MKQAKVLGYTTIELPHPKRNAKLWLQHLHSPLLRTFSIVCDAIIDIIIFSILKSPVYIFIHTKPSVMVVHLTFWQSEI